MPAASPVTLIARAAECDQRTVRRAIRGDYVHPAIRARIERALAELAPAPAKSARPTEGDDQAAQ